MCLGAYRIQSLVVRGSCLFFSPAQPVRHCSPHSRSLLSGEALEQDLGVAIDAEVLDRLRILRGAGRILPGGGLGERRAHGLSDCLHRDEEVATKAQLDMAEYVVERVVRGTGCSAQEAATWRDFFGCAWPISTPQDNVRPHPTSHENGSLRITLHQDPLQLLVNGCRVLNQSSEDGNSDT